MLLAHHQEIWYSIFLPLLSISSNNEGSFEPQEKKRKESHHHKSSIALVPIPSLEYNGQRHAIVLFLIRWGMCAKFLILPFHHNIPIKSIQARYQARCKSIITLCLPFTTSKKSKERKPINGHRRRNVSQQRWTTKCKLKKGGILVL